MSDKLLKEIDEFQKEKIHLEKSLELNKKKFINEIRNGMGEKIKTDYSKPTKVKVSTVSKIKRWLKKYL